MALDHWTINPLFRPLRMLLDEDGDCALPHDQPHCHGGEVQHLDGIAECISEHGSCEAPGPGHHAHVHPCEPELLFLYGHTCHRCDPTR